MDPKQTIGFKKEQGEPEAPRRRIVTRSRSRSRRRISPDRRRSRDVRSPDRRRSSSWDSRPDGDGGWKREVYFVFGSAGNCFVFGSAGNCYGRIFNNFHF